MRIEAGVHFHFTEAPVYKDFPILFHDNRLYADSEVVSAEPRFFCPCIPFIERSMGCAPFNYPRKKWPEQLHFDLCLRAVLENKCDLTVPDVIDMSPVFRTPAFE